MKRIGKISLAAGAICLAWTAASSFAEEPDTKRMAGTVEAGLLSYTLSGGYGDWHGEFVRSVVHSDKDTVWNGDLVDIRQFGEHAQVGAVAVTHTFNEDWYASAAVAGSSNGNTQARLKLDASLSLKLLPEHNLVATAGLGAADSRDGHHDRSLLVAGAYYFSIPLVIEGGIRFNRSNPGEVESAGKYLAATYGREKESVVSLRYGFGNEGYQAIGSAGALTDFKSDVLTLTWREWINREWAVQTRAEWYRNPYYDRRGLELSAVREF